MLLKPFVDWLPSRSRKLLPRLVTVEPADRSELITLGVGLGVGVGVGVGVGEGVGDCADAEAATPAASTNAIRTVRTWRHNPFFPAREGRDEQRMHSIPKRRRASPKNAGNRSTRYGFALNSRGASIVVVARPQVAGGPERFREAGRRLANP
jgi:hypothetical protein